MLFIFKYCQKRMTRLRRKNNNNNKFITRGIIKNNFLLCH